MPDSWDDVYNKELNNFSDHGDVGEVWFGEESIFRIIRWLRYNYNGSKEDLIIDLGCGNGMMLVELAREGYQHLVGLDYSKQAIKLASSIISKQEMDSVVSFKECDLLSEKLESSAYSVALDKGTYDAISLSPIQVKEKCSLYIKKVHDIVKPNGLFIITTCNWTDKEIISQFSEYFGLHSVIPTPEFKFAGKVGKLVSCIVLQRIN